MKKDFIGELIGTFILVFFGCGAVAVSIIFDAFAGLFPIALIWGFAVTLAILISGPISGAHLNPAITLAFASLGELSKKKLPLYFAGQFAGAFIAAATLFLLFEKPLKQFELREKIVRGQSGSEATARIFGEFHNPEWGMGAPFLAEFLGTALLAFFVFSLVDKRRKPCSLLPNHFIAIAIGAALTLLICIFAPISMAGFNPARDLAPRIFSCLAGWGALPFTCNGLSWLVVYICAPFLGAMAGARLARACVNFTLEAD